MIVIFSLILGACGKSPARRDDDAAMQTNGESVIKTNSGTETGGPEKGELTKFCEWGKGLIPGVGQNNTVNDWWNRLDKFWAFGTAVLIIVPALCLKPETGPTTIAKIKNLTWYLGVVGASFLVGDAVGSARRAGYGYGGMAICGLVGLTVAGGLAYFTRKIGTEGSPTEVEIQEAKAAIAKAAEAAKNPAEIEKLKNVITKA
jgi:uncharacterized membrane protein YdcZ (DUF606 family)